MARKHIRDLRAMRHGKAYHSDGHVSESSSKAGTGDGHEDISRSSSHQANMELVPADNELQPGQTRKRLRRHDSTDANNALLFDNDSDASSSSSSSMSSDASVQVTHVASTRALLDADDQPSPEEAEEMDEAPTAWWSVNRLDSYVPYRERDAIDRMLSRTGGRKISAKSNVRKAPSHSHHRQARLDGFVSTHRHRRTSECFNSIASAGD